jgi:hypothetical protein
MRFVACRFEPGENQRSKSLSGSCPVWRPCWKLPVAAYSRNSLSTRTPRCLPSARIYCARKTIDAAIRAETGEYGDTLEDTARIDHLAHRLSRERVKTTTLDLTDIAKYAQRHANRARHRETELSHEL